MEINEISDYSSRIVKYTNSSSSTSVSRSKGLRKKFLILIMLCFGLAFGICINSPLRGEESQEKEGIWDKSQGQLQGEKSRGEGHKTFPKGKILFVFHKKFSCTNQSKSMDQIQVSKYATSSLNRALFDSKATVQEEVFDTKPAVQVQPWQGVPPGDPQKDIQYLVEAIKPSSRFNFIHKLRVVNRADIVALVGPTGTAQYKLNDEPVSTGIDGISSAYSGKNDPNRAYVIVNDSVQDCDEFVKTFVHEIGHLLGANHDKKLLDRNMSSVYKYGFIGSSPYSCGNAGVNSDCIKTIMTHEKECVLLFSNKDIKIDGCPVGSPKADNVAIIKQTLPQILRFGENLSL